MKKITISIKAGNGLKETDGYIDPSFPGLAIQHLDHAHGGQGFWTVTHLSTGKNATIPSRGYSLRREAAAYARKLCEFGDWTQSDPKSALGANLRIALQAAQEAAQET